MELLKEINKNIDLNNLKKTIDHILGDDYNEYTNHYRIISDKGIDSYISVIDGNIVKIDENNIRNLELIRPINTAQVFYVNSILFAVERSFDKSIFMLDGSHSSGKSFCTILTILSLMIKNIIPKETIILINEYRNIKFMIKDKLKRLEEQYVDILELLDLIVLIDKKDYNQYQLNDSIIIINQAEMINKSDFLILCKFSGKNPFFILGNFWNKNNHENNVFEDLLNTKLDSFELENNFLVKTEFRKQVNVNPIERLLDT